MTEQKNCGLYTPSLESDACGIGLMAQLNGIASHQLVSDALLLLSHLEHRGACGCEPNTGDGAGILVQLPHDFFKAVADFSLPVKGSYGVGMLLFPGDEALYEGCWENLKKYIEELDFKILGVRKVPVNPAGLGPSALAVAPRMEQVFLQHKENLTGEALERKLYIFRKYASHKIFEALPTVRDVFYFASLSSRTHVYKGQLTTYQLGSYFPDLQDERFESAIALVHSRFSTNTVPKWKLAQPFRFIAHNGEINTITGNLNWWRAREALLAEGIFSKEDLALLRPICGDKLSDSANFDNVLEFLVMSGYSLPHALMMMIPEAWEHDTAMPDMKKAFYDYHRALMEPWDGPASLVFTDGTIVGATLDRNGLRPSRYVVTTNNTLVLSSEAGALPIPPSRIAMRGRLQSGKILLGDLSQGRLITDEEIKEQVCSAHPYREWLQANRKRIDREDIAQVWEKPTTSIPGPDFPSLLRKFGYTREDLKVILTPMATKGEEPVGSMGADTPLAILSQRPQHLSNYFKQLFAQVTNPPIDPIRERPVMSLFTLLGGSDTPFKTSSKQAERIHLSGPVLSEQQGNALAALKEVPFISHIIATVFDASGASGDLRKAIDSICAEAEKVVKQGANILILSDRNASTTVAPIPSLLAVGAVHHHLIGKGLRMQTSLVVEAGDIWEVHHFATLIGFGANAVFPYLAYDAIAYLFNNGDLGTELGLEMLLAKYIKSVEKGLLKVISKIGISTLQSYHGAQVFEILGLNREVVDSCFIGAVSRISGLSFDGIAREVLTNWNLAISPDIEISDLLSDAGLYQWKKEGEAHLLTPQAIHYLQYASRKGELDAYRKYTQLVNDQSKQSLTLRGLLQFKDATPIALEEVEPIEDILKRFSTGAMSFGSISFEAHTTLAIAMNRIGARSNSGEGGEDEIRYEPQPNGDQLYSAIKQVASGRFGVTSHYLANAEELQIKVAQGAKPGEGGQLPGHKVDEWIGRVRHATPGVSLISPPPHHDIYSIEDLAQLIFDLKNSNPKARISVKLVSKAGVGVIASGVAKAHADAILISGHDGGTGASPLSSIRHAGLPWELGLAETHQTLMRNGLRDRVVVQTDGQIRTGRDLAIATLLGAEEWGIATAALIVEGCIMMRKCHLNTCPVGIATQDPELRKHFSGKPEHVIQFFTFLAQDLREIMAELGFRTIKEMVGRVDKLEFPKDQSFWKYKSLDLSPVLFEENNIHRILPFKQREQDHGIDNVLDHKLIRAATPAIQTALPMAAEFNVTNTDRAVGTMLSYHISRLFGSKGLPDELLRFRFRGSAGQSFGAFGASGIHFVLEGEANDYFGKGLSGARLIAVPDRESRIQAHRNIIVGNVALYGATTGEVYIMGQAGERFAVRNSGVTAVVEGLGDHGCEYMTGGVVVVLGNTGKNFAAGMSGGVAFLYKPDKNNINPELVEIEALDSDDRRLLRRLVRNHFTYTSSPLALNLLQHWTMYRKDFVKIMPRDFKKAMHQGLSKGSAEVKPAVVST